MFVIPEFSLSINFISEISPGETAFTIFSSVDRFNWSDNVDSRLWMLVSSSNVNRVWIVLGVGFWCIKATLYLRWWPEFHGQACSGSFVVGLWAIQYRRYYEPHSLWAVGFGGFIVWVAQTFDNRSWLYVRRPLILNVGLVPNVWRTIRSDLGPWKL